MSTKTLLTIIWIATLLIIISTFSMVIIKFNDHILSNDLAQWGQFGDYIGGILNPLVAVLNLFIFAYLSIRLVKVEDDRNKWTMKELVRPYGDLIYSSNLGYLSISLENYGLGPLIVTSVEIVDSSGNIHFGFTDLVKTYGNKHTMKMEVVFGNITSNHGVIRKDGALELLNITIKDAPVNVGQFNNLKNHLNSYSISIDYSDMYGVQIASLKQNIHFA